MKKSRLGESRKGQRGQGGPQVTVPWQWQLQSPVKRACLGL